MDDQEIIRLYLNRDESAIEQTAKKYGCYCNRIAENFLDGPEDVEECVNDTYHALWNQIPPEVPQSFPAFLGRIIRNLAISRFRELHARKRFSEMEIMLSELDGCIPSNADVEQEIDSRFLSEKISDWLTTLRKEDCNLFIRRYWYGDPLGELAAEYSQTPAKMAQKMMRLRKKLRKYLEQEDISL